MSHQHPSHQEVSFHWYRPPHGIRLPPFSTPALGDVLVAAVARADLDAPATPIVEMRKQHPWAPLVLLVPGMGAEDLTAAATLLQRTAARVLDDGSGGFPGWRSRLLDTGTLARDFGSILRVLRPTLSEKTTAILRGLVSGGAAGESFGDVVAHFDDQLRAIEARLKRSRLRPPSAYHLFGGLAPSIGALAREPAVRVRDVIYRSPYADRATFARGVVQHLGTTPSRARHRVPWEWIAWRMQLYNR